MNAMDPSKTPLLTFVVPVKTSAFMDGPKYLRCLLSLMEQRSEYPLETLLVLDGTDGIPMEELMHRIGSETRDAMLAMKQLFIDPMIPADDAKRSDNSVRTLILEKRCGPGGARNAGVNEAKGKWIWCIDADDWLTDPYITDSVLRFIQTRPPETAVIQWTMFQGKFPCQDSEMMPWLRIVRKDVLQKVPFPENKQTNEDTIQFEALKKYLSANKLTTFRTGKVPYFYNWMSPGSANASRGGGD